MAIADTTNSRREAGNGAKVTFDFPFRIYAVTHLVVYKITNSTEARTLQVYGTDYTVSFLSTVEGGSITFTTAPTSLQDSFIERELPYTQATNIPAVGGVREQTLEGGLDKLCILILQLKKKLDLSLKFISSSEQVDILVPEPESLKSLRWNAAANALENYTPTVTTLTYSGSFLYGASASKAAVPSAGDIYVALDTSMVYFCFTAGVWSAISPDGSLFTNLANIPSIAGRIPLANLPLVTPNNAVTLTDAATIVTNAALGSHFIVTLGGNRTLANPTNPVARQKVIFEFIQDATGSRTIALGSDFIFGTDITSVTLTTTASKRDLMACIYNGSKWVVVGFVRGYA